MDRSLTGSIAHRVRSSIALTAIPDPGKELGMAVMVIKARENVTDGEWLGMLAAKCEAKYEGYRINRKLFAEEVVSCMNHKG
jgi:hypothetical protein